MDGQPTEKQRQQYLKDVEKFEILFTDDVHVSQLAKMDWDMDDLLCTVAIYVSHVAREHGHEIHGEE